MRRISVALAVVLPLLVTAPACKLASRNRVQSINRMNEGIKLEAKNNTSQAERALKESIELDPTHAKAHYTLGQIYRKQGKLVDAENSFSNAIANMGEDPNADYHYQLGVVIAAAGDADGVSQTDQEAKYNAAIAAFQDAIKLKPKHYKAHYRMGVLYERLDQPEQADQAFRTAIENKPSYSPAFVSLGNLYIDYGHANVAMAVLQLGTQVNDKDARMWNGLGRALLSLNKPDEAVESFKKAKAIDPDMVDVLFGLGMAYADLRQRKDSVENLQAFLQRAGNDVPEDRKKAANNTIARMQDVI
jgi:tetratricopeptide (TPR) repeat protein